MAVLTVEVKQYFTMGSKQQEREVKETELIRNVNHRKRHKVKEMKERKKERKMVIRSLFLRDLVTLKTSAELLNCW